MKRIGFGLVLLCAFAALNNNVALADELYPAALFTPAPVVQFDVGVRYWYSTGKSQKTLFNGAGTQQLSRLTWTDQTGHAGEGYFNISQSHVFAKGFIGAGIFAGGKLQDEDFEPFTTPYSSTDSQTKNSRFEYASIDLGYYLLDSAQAKLGGFVGYHYNRDRISAYGCTQTATNPGCQPSIPNSIQVITQEYRWHAIRLGVAGEVSILPNLKLSGDVAWLPRVNVTGDDWHWLRIGTDFNGPTPERGRGTGFQAEGILSYAFENNVTLGVGGRYWHFDAPNSTAHFEDSTLFGGPQVEKIKSTRYGAFVQLGLKY